MAVSVKFYWVKRVSRLKVSRLRDPRFSGEERLAYPKEATSEVCSQYELTHGSRNGIVLLSSQLLSFPRAYEGREEASIFNDPRV